MDEEYKERRNAVHHALGKMLSEQLQIPVYGIDSEILSSLCDIVSEAPRVTDLYTREELYAEVSEFVMRLVIANRFASETLEQDIDQFVSQLTTEKLYEAAIILPSVIGLPIGSRVVDLEIVEATEPDESFSAYLTHLQKRKRVYLDGRAHGMVRFKAYTTSPRHIMDRLYEKLELPLAILSLVLEFDLDTKDCVGVIKSSDTSTGCYVEPHHDIRGWVRYDAKHNSEYYEKLTQVSTGRKQSSLIKKILQAVHVYGLSRLSHRLEIRFIFLISAFESLLLTKSDRDYIGTKLSEKVAFLLEDTYEKRLSLYGAMKKYYGKRSDMVHSGKSSVTLEEVEYLHFIFRKVVFELLVLNERYPKMEQKSGERDQDGIEDYLHKLRFS